IGGAYLTPQQILEAARAVRTRTTRPFGISLFAPQPALEAPRDPRPALECVAPFYAELELPAPQAPALAADSFGEQLAAALEAGASVFSFTFGILPASAVEAVKARGMFLVGTATTVDEAVALEKAGVDAVVTQGAEAGGHRGSFAAEFEAAMVGTISLVPQVVDAVRIPVIASGGIMDGRGIAAALALGAQAVQMGTAFLVCGESGVPDAYKEAILRAREHETRLSPRIHDQPPGVAVHRRERHRLRAARRGSPEGRALPAGVCGDQPEPPGARAGGRRFPPDREFGDSQVPCREDRVFNVPERAASAGEGERNDGLDQYAGLPRVRLRAGLPADLPEPQAAQRRGAR